MSTRKGLAPSVVPAGRSLGPSAIRTSLAILAVGLATFAARGQDIVVTGGDVQSNSSPTSAGSLYVSGTSAGGSPSTYDANATLTLAGNLAAHDLGVVNANADVTVAGYSNAYYGGVINLNAGTLSSYQLQVEGAGSLNQSGGHYSVQNFNLLDHATASYGPGDTIASQAVVTGTSTLTLQQNMTLSGYLEVFSGGSIARGSETISAYAIYLDDATMSVRSTDVFVSYGTTSVYSGAELDMGEGSTIGNAYVAGKNASNAPSTLSINGNSTAGNINAYGGAIINLATGTLTANQIDTSGAGSIGQNGGNYALGSLYVRDGASVVYGAGDSVAQVVSVTHGGTFSLDKDLVLGNSLSLSGPTAFATNGHNYSAAQVSLLDHMALTYGPLDSITQSVLVSGTSTLTLNQNLNLSGYLQVYGGGSVARSSESITAYGFVVDDAALSITAADTFTPYGYSYVGTGGLVNTSQGSTLGSVSVYGKNAANVPSTLTINGDTTAGGLYAYAGGVIDLSAGTLSTGGLYGSGAGSILQNGGHYNVSALDLHDGATLLYGTGDTVTQSVYVSGGSSLTLDQDLVLANTLSLSGPSSFVPAGHHYTAANLSLDVNAAVTYGPGDSITNQVSVNGSSTLTLAQDLNLTGYLYLTNGGSLTRTTEAISAYAFYLSDATLSVGAADAFNPSAYSYVYGGGVANVAAGSTLGGVIVSGANASSAPSTLNVNGDATTGYVQVSGGGVVNLNAGTLTASTLDAYSPGSIVRAAGHYAVNSLSLTNGATLDYTTGDSVTTSVSVGAASTFTLDQNLAISGALGLSNGGSIARTTQSISAASFDVYDSTLALGSSDTFSPTGYGYVRSGGVVSVPAGVTLGHVQIYGVNGSSAPARLDVNGATTAASIDAWSSGVVNVNADLGLTDDTNISSGGVLNLNAGTLSTRSLVLSGAGSAVQNGGHYAVGSGSLTLSNGATLGYGPGDSVTTEVNLQGGSTLTLAQNLALTGPLYLTDGGSITRTTQSISADHFAVHNAMLALAAADTFNPAAYSYVAYGAVVSTAAGSTLGHVQVYGVNGSSAPATLDVNGDTTATSVAAWSSGVVNLHSGTLSTADLSLSDVGSVTQTGGHYAVTNLWLSGGATLGYGPADSVDTLSINGAGSLLDEFSPLSLASLSVANGGVLRLDSFTGSGAVSNWGLRVDGDQSSYLNTLILGNLITGPSLQVVYDSGSNFTYITTFSVPVPEIDPASGLSALSLAMGALGLLERRGRRRTSGGA